VIPQPIREQVAQLAQPSKDIAPTADEALVALDDVGSWWFDIKWDGIRCLAYVENGEVQLINRRQRDITFRYPDVVEALAKVYAGMSVVLDGEIVAFDADGRPSFEALQSRMHVTNSAQVRRLMSQTPVTYLVFDVLYVDGRSLLEETYVERRRVLDSLSLSGPSWQTPPHFEGDGDAVLAASREQGLEGVLAKRLDSRYYAGKRSDCWLKVKNLRTQEVVIGGWKPGAGRRAGAIGSLLLGVPGPAGLEFAGHVGTGFTDRMLRDLEAQLAPLAREDSPFDTTVPREHARTAKWVEPSVVGEVAFGEWTREGRLRHPAWRGLRPDKSAADVVRES
jgi:bifunctional non-homologous end joining protein LigD